MLVLVGAFGLGGCLGDPAPDPAKAPLEVVVEGCELNRPDVAPGTHEVSVINQDNYQPAQLVVTDEDGREVLSLAAGKTKQMVTTNQTYTFTCSVGSEMTTSMLESTTR
ncbi:MAG: hypothetical protein WCF36_13180 [Candidatus Nanopelagicales bacterium]